MKRKLLAALCVTVCQQVYWQDVAAVIKQREYKNRGNSERGDFFSGRDGDKSCFF